MRTVEVGGERLLLLPEKAALWPDRQMLLVADAHVGKAHSFRRLGVPVPRGSTARTLELLAELVRRHQVRQLVFLGDLLHSAHAQSPSTLEPLAAWRARHAELHLTLVRGNHDLRAGEPPRALGIEVVDEPLRLGGLALAHHPRPVDAAYTVAGHLHPCVHAGRGFERLRLPCFHFGAQVAVLPAFGAFTGMHPVRPAEGDRVFVVVDDAVREIGR